MLFRGSSLMFTLSISLLHLVFGRAIADPQATPSSQKFYSSNFVNPKPPTLQSEFRANYMQHKYDANINDHIINGFLYMSPSQKKIRVDGAGDGILEAHIFDFNNVTANGTVADTALSYTGGLTNPSCSFFYVSPFIQLIPPDFLSQVNAVFAGIQQDDMYGPLDAWTYSAGGSLILTLFLDFNDTLVRYDFASSDSLRTFATTRFFNIIQGPVDASVFDISCK